ncbi:MAG: NADH-quinone oxidoreductase subunit NuoE family protein [Armatimonadota bacterium]
MQSLCKYISEHRDPVRPQGSLIAVLHKAQDTFGFLSPEVMSVVAHELDVPESYVWGVATFYSYFTLKPRGKYPVAVCMGTACYVKGATAILNTIKGQLNIKVGETSDDGLFSLVETRCIGACGLAPIMTVGEEVFGRLTADQVPEILAKYQKMK